MLLAAIGGRKWGDADDVPKISRGSGTVRLPRNETKRELSFGGPALYGTDVCVIRDRIRSDQIKSVRWTRHTYTDNQFALGRKKVAIETTQRFLPGEIEKENK